MVVYGDALPCIGPGTRQRAWLIADLAAVDRALTPWTIIIVHQPWHNTNWAHRAENALIQRALEDLVQSADLVLSGHIHSCVAGGIERKSLRLARRSCLLPTPLAHLCPATRARSLSPSFPPLLFVATSAAREHITTLATAARRRTLS